MIISTNRSLYIGKNRIIVLVSERLVNGLANGLHEKKIANYKPR